MFYFSLFLQATANVQSDGYKRDCDQQGRRSSGNHYKQLIQNVTELYLELFGFSFPTKKWSDFMKEWSL